MNDLMKRIFPNAKIAPLSERDRLFQEWFYAGTPSGWNTSGTGMQQAAYSPENARIRAAAEAKLMELDPWWFQQQKNALATGNRKSHTSKALTFAGLAGAGVAASALTGAGGAGATGGGTAAGGSSAVPSAVAGGGATTPAAGVFGGASMPGAMQAGVAIPTGGSGAMGVGAAGAGASAAGGSFDFLDGIFGEGAGNAAGGIAGAASGFWNNGGRELLGAGIGAWQSNQSSKDYLDAAKYAADRADPFYNQRPQYQGMLQKLMTDPNSIQETPSYQFRFDQGQNALERSLSAKGYLGSGNLMHDLQSYGQGMASQEYDNQFGRLSTLSGATFGPGNAGGVYQQGAGQSIAQNQQTWGNLGTIGRVIGDRMAGNNSPMFSNYT